MLLKGTEHWLPVSTSLPAFSLSLSRGMHGDNADNEEGDLPRRKPEDDLLYIILGIIVGAILIGVLVALFICARQHCKQRRLLGTTV